MANTDVQPMHRCIPTIYVSTLLLKKSFKCRTFTCSGVFSQCGISVFTEVSFSMRDNAGLLLVVEYFDSVELVLLLK